MLLLIYAITVVLSFVTMAYFYTNDLDMRVDDALIIGFISLVPGLNVIAALAMLIDYYVRDLVLIKKRGK